MADSRPFLLLDSSGAPLTGATPSTQAWDRTGAARPGPTVVELGSGLYAVNPSDADEAAGTVVLVTTGAEPARVTLACYLTSRANQFWAWHLEDAAGALWTGAAPTVVMRDASGTRTTASLVVPTAGLFVLVPSTADVTADASILATSPTGAYPDSVTGGVEPVAADGGASTPTLAPSAGLSPEAVAVSALREYLVRWLPAKVAQLNALRPATLKSASVEPFAVPAGAHLRLSAVSREDTGTLVALTSGSRTAAQVAAELSVSGLTASADYAGRLVLTSDTAPAVGLPSVVALKSDGTGGNAAFGWDAGGEHQVVGALVAPGLRGVLDGWPVAAPDSGQGFWVLLGDRQTRPWPSAPSVRRDEYEVRVQCDILKPEGNLSPSRDRGGITACVRAVRELLATAEGRYLGRAGMGDVQLADVPEATIRGVPFSFEGNGLQTLFDSATLTLTVRVFARPE